MLDSAFKRLIKYGFFRKDHPLADKYKEKSAKEREIMLLNMPEKTAQEFSHCEWAEEYKDVYMATEYPQPRKRYWLAFESPNLNIEEMYYWMHHQLSVENSMHMTKVVDTYAASEASSFFGMMQQRISIQQGNVSNFLKGISDMVKGLFQIVREVRILNDRLQYYVDTYEQNENALSSEIVLKGLWVDQVEGGAKNPSSVYGLSSNVGFTILPDLFFRIRLKGPKEVDEKVEQLQFNEKVKEVLKRKLRQYYEWKERTFKELGTRKRFELKYLRQHYETINLYISWIKPYLRYVKRMQQMEKLEMDSRLIKSFEGAFVEIEVLAKKKKGGTNAVVLFTFMYRSRPETLIHQPHEYSQRGPIHIGRAEARLRAYTWTDDDIKNYIEYKKEEDIALLSAIDESIKEAMDALGDELKSYLGIEGEAFGDEQKIHELAKNLVANGLSPNIDEGVKKAREMIEARKKRLKGKGAAEPFVALVGGFADIFKAFGGLASEGTGDKKKKPKVDQAKTDKEVEEAKKDAKLVAYLVHKNYKKAHKMLTW